MKTFGLLTLFVCFLAFAPHPPELPQVEESWPGKMETSTQALEKLTAGYGSFGGSLVWVESIFSYADVLFKGSSSVELITLFRWTAELDTLWAYPRLIAGWAIPQMHGLTRLDALPFLEDGARRFPQQWLFRITWAQYILEDKGIDSTLARDSAAKILLPLSAVSSAGVPQYARTLAFTLLHRNGRPEEAMSLLLQTYEQVPDPMVRLQFREKIGDILLRNRVSFGADSADFMGGIGSLLESKDVGDHVLAGRILIGLVDIARREAALIWARQLVDQFRSYRSAGVSVRR